MEPKASPDRLTAEVKGKGGNYVVTLDMALDEERKRSVISVLCSCPYYAEGRGCCKHIWAAICAADGMQEGAFKAKDGYPPGFRSRVTPLSSRRPAVVSADPNAAGRIRAFTAADHAAPAAQKDSDNRQQRHQNNHQQTSWREALKIVGHAQRDIVDAQAKHATPVPATGFHYVVDVEATRRTGQLTLQLYRHVAPHAEQPAQLAPFPIDPRAFDVMADGSDKALLAGFLGVASSSVVRQASAKDEAGMPIRIRDQSFVVADSLRAPMLEQMAATGRLGWLAIDDAKHEAGTPVPTETFRVLQWDAGAKWVFRLAVGVRKRDRAWVVRGEFQRGRTIVPLGDSLYAFSDGMALFKEQVVSVDMPDARAHGWISTLRQVGAIKVEKADQAAFLRTLVGLPSAPRIVLPSDSGWTIVTGEPKPRLVFHTNSAMQMPGVLTGNYEFDYETPAAPPLKAVPPPEEEAPAAEEEEDDDEDQLGAEADAAGAGGAAAPAREASEDDDEDDDADDADDGDADDADDDADDATSAEDGARGDEPAAAKRPAATSGRAVAVAPGGQRRAVLRPVKGQAPAQPAAAQAAAPLGAQPGGPQRGAPAGGSQRRIPQQGAPQPGSPQRGPQRGGPQQPQQGRGNDPRRGGNGDQANPLQRRVVVRRDRDREEQMIKDLLGNPGVHPSAGRQVAGADVFIDAATLAELVADLVGRGWTVEAEGGQKLRTGKSFHVDVKSSGMDWLDLRASFDFGGGTRVELPKLLEAVRRGDGRVQLSDGSVGLLPEQWRKKLEPILLMGEGDGEGQGLRFRSSHAAFLDVLVSEASAATLDENFTEYRKKLASFAGIGSSTPDPGFTGELRPYQQQGLGWLEFLDEFAFGGCLADDMGLGKTVQVLAFLHKRRMAKKKKKRAKTLPSLICCPTSLIHNWIDEAKKFTADLKVKSHVGASRMREASEFAGYDVIVTSYGTMRSDIEMLAEAAFDYVILDEAQAIKNESTQLAKAARALKAQRRLAMSGTPVENRLAELGSIFRFLNPGMLDNAQVFAELFSGSGKISQGKLETLARVLKPFILRRTKEQVLPDLPSKIESVVYCELEGDQRREYDELAAHYRDVLKKKIKTAGIGGSHMHVLEALLRLRQLACHPGLIDEKRVADPSAKLDLLEEQLEEALDTGRKALVFSQFTSMLAIVKTRLDAKGIKYEYLDGSTRDRKERVEHFQNDPETRVFLISLKAGGFGLNLTAADYCFIIDPWWNPAAEAQAIDRAHRIGQTSQVFAYRLIARGTVEEKILELQAAKRKLVEGIIADDGGVLADLSAKDLDFLLG